jgi:hypothetical protein
MAQAIERLLCKHKALMPPKKKKKLHVKNFLDYFP